MAKAENKSEKKPVETVTLSLSFNEQAQFTAILNLFKGSMLDLAFVLDDVKMVKVSKEDLEKVDAKDTIDPRTGAPSGMKSWNEEKAEALGEREFEVSEISVEFVKKHIDERSKKGELTIRDASTIALRKKLS